MKIPPRITYLVMAIAAIGLLACGWYLQHVLKERPCPLCILQRMAFIGIAAVSLVGAVTGHWPLARNERTKGISDLEWPELSRVVPIVVATFLLGIVPSYVLDHAGPTVQQDLYSFDMRWSAAQSTYNTMVVAPSPAAEPAPDDESDDDADSDEGAPIRGVPAVHPGGNAP